VNRELRNEKGSALITTILICAMVTVIATSIISRQAVDIRRTANTIDAGQADMLARSVEAWAINLLLTDAREDNEDVDPVDCLGESWSQPLEPTQVEVGKVSGSIEDLQARFNLNNLLYEAADTTNGKFCRRQLQRLAADCGLEADILDAITDWLDNNQERQFPGGAEDEEYLALPSPYRTADGPMTSPSELRLVLGVDETSFRCLLPRISTLPESTMVNVNTASAVILASLSEDIDLATAENIVEARPTEGYASVDAFLAIPQLAGAGIEKGFLTVQSNYYMVTSEAEFGRARMQLYSVLHRKNDNRETGPGIEILGRSIGVY